MRLVSGLRELPRKDDSSVRTQAWLVHMSDNPITSVFHSNHYTARSACEHCQGISRHEPWCITVDRTVYYAYEIVADPSRLTIGDAIILHSLGVLWASNSRRGKCRIDESLESRPTRITPADVFRIAQKIGS